MINPMPTFMDISIVKHRADKMAYCLAKVASEGSDLSTAFENYLNEGLDKVSPEVVYEIPETDELLGSQYWDNEVDTDKTASIKKVSMDKQVPAESVRVLNHEIHDLLPALEKLEPTLPDDFLVNIAKKYPLNDILRTFTASAIPLKPQEFTRIVIIQRGLPDEAFNPVLEGVLKAKSSKAIPQGTIRTKLLSSLLPFEEARSSLLPFLSRRLKLIFSDVPKDLSKTAASVYRPNPVLEYLDQNAGLSFGHVRRVPDYQDLNGGLPSNTVFVNYKGFNSGIPAAMTQEQYEQEVRRPSLSVQDKHQLVALGSMIGGDYAAYKNPAFLLSILREPDFLSTLAMLSGAAKGVKESIFGSNNTKQVKTASSDLSVEDIVLEHLANAYMPKTAAVVDVIPEALMSDGVKTITKTASVKNNIINAAEVTLLPLYITSKSASPITSWTRYALDGAALSETQKKLLNS